MYKMKTTLTTSLSVLLYYHYLSKVWSFCKAFSYQFQLDTLFNFSKIRKTNT